MCEMAMTTGKMLQPPSSGTTVLPGFSATMLVGTRRQPSAAAHDALLPFFAMLFVATLAFIVTQTPRLPELPAPARNAVLVLHKAITALTPKFLVINAQAPAAATAYEQEMAMGPRQLLHRWDPLIAKASARFGVPAEWIRAVIRAESGGRTMTGEDQPITSRAGAMGLMQVMAETYRDMRLQYHLGADPYAPYDNIVAGTAYLRRLHARYGFPDMFAAYNDGPGNFERRQADGTQLPSETREYLTRVAGTVDRHHRRYRA